MSLPPNFWYKKTPIPYLLTPFSGLYRLALAIKTLSYRLGLKKTTHFSVPVIVIGNITVGGTGKTPLIIALAQFLLAQGYKPGIVSRGYGGQARHFPVDVTAASDPRMVGDEPVLIARKTGCPLVVDPNRVNAVRTLLQQHACNVVLSDDGLQHTALGRDIELAVIDGKRRFGNGFCLPAGPLREPIKRLQTVDFQVTRGGAQPGEWEMRFIPETIYNLQDKQRTLTAAQCNQPVHAVAGIGHPEAFFTQLRQLGFTIQEHPFPDHHRFTAKDIDFGANAVVIMTEKDAIKCEPFADRRHWCLPIALSDDSQALFSQLLQRLVSVLK